MDAESFNQTHLVVEEIPLPIFVTYKARNASEDFSRNGLVRVPKGCSDFKELENLFLSGMDFLAEDTNIVAIHYKDGFPTDHAQYAWYAGSKEDVCKIFTNGFSRVECPKIGVSYGFGVYLYSDSIYGALSSVADESRIKHLLLCRVDLGKVEVIPPGSKQLGPSSEEFNSGVDDAQTPKRYIIWGASKNTRVSPVCVISFKTPSFKEFIHMNEIRGTPNFGMARAHQILFMLSKILTPVMMDHISKLLKDCIEDNKLSDSQMIEKVIDVAGEYWLERYSHTIEGMKESSRIGIHTPLILKE